MLHSKRSHVTLLLLAAVSTALLITGCAGKRAWYGDPDKGLILEYRFSEKQPATYRSSNDFTQTLEVMGQTMEISSEESLQFSLRSKGTKEHNHHLEVTIDSLSAHLSTPRGDMEPDTKPVLGGSFDLILSVIGEELELIGADGLEYEYTPTEKRNVSTGFQALFPNMPGGPITVGGTWTTRDTVYDHSEKSEMSITFNTIHTLAGFEKMNGFECAKITNTFTGTISGTGMEGGLELISTADIEGTGTYYIAYKKGLLVNDESHGIADGTITVAGPQEMKIPMTRKFVIKTELVRN
jgi:hypothetical protein